MPLPSTPRMLSEVAGPFRILTVCSGNICRSPLAEALLARSLEPLARVRAVQLASAGTVGMVDARVDPPAAAEAARLGLDVTNHRGRRLTASAVAGAHLVLGMTREHRAKAVDLDPSAGRRVFTLRELRAVLNTLEPTAFDPDASVGDRLAAIVDEAASRRGLVTSTIASELDIDDPYQRDPDVHRRVADEIDLTVTDLVHDLRRLLG